MKRGISARLPLVNGERRRSHAFGMGRAQNQSIAGVAENKVGKPDYLVANAKGKYG
jgi:hypothetical protein